MMKKQLLLFLSLTVSISVLNAQTDRTVLKLRSGNVQPTEANDLQSVQSVISNLDYEGDYFIVQFDQIPTEQEKGLLNDLNIQLLDYLPEYSFVANMQGFNANKTIGELGIRSITPFLAQYKFPDYFDLATAPDYVTATGTEVRLMVDRQLDHTSSDFANFLETNGIEIEEVGIMAENFKIILAKDRIDWLADQDIVKFIDYAPAPPEAEDDRGRSLHRSNMLDSDDPMGRNYTGDGVSIAIADNGLGPHIDRKGRVTMHTTVNNGTHGDMTTGIAVGAGNLDPRYRGMATKAYLHYYNISGYPHINQAATNYTVRGVVVTSTSFSQGCNAGYTSDTRAADNQVGTYTSILHVFSAGNSAGSSCGGNTYGAGTPWGTITGGIKQGKSVIAVGNLDYLGNIDPSSSRGPARDGRIKPDICSNGRNQISTDPNNGYSPGGGTSAAAPGIAGIATQLYEGYRDLNANADPPSSLIKAVLLNTARDIGNEGPDFFYGWGRVNAHRAMLTLEENRYINSSISQNGNNSHSITLANPAEELRVMVYWNDAAGAVLSAKALVNDIDISVITPNNDTLLPWVLDSRPNATFLSQPATKGVDDLNNVEQVSIDNATGGTYTVLVNGTAIPQGPQSYHVVWEPISDSITVTYPTGGESFVPGEVETIRWDAKGNTGLFSIEYSIDSGATWTFMTNVIATRRYQNWSVPNVASGNVLVRVNRAGNVSGVSRNTFNIMRQPTGLAVNYTCPDSVEIRWNAVAGATHYDIYLLGNRFMDSVGTTTGTSFKFYNLNLANENWWAIQAHSNDIKGRRTLARTIPGNVLNCPLDYDLSILQIQEPSSGFIQNCIYPKVPVRIGIRNTGDSVLTNIPVKATLGNSVIRDTIAGPIASNVITSFTFSDSIAVTSTGTAILSVVNELAIDQDETNDSIAKPLDIAGGTAFTVPYTNDFESFNLCSTNSNCGATTCNLNGGWLNVDNSSDDHDMRVNSGTTPSNNTGPSLDHNPGTGSGKYLYSEASNGCTGATSELLTPCFDLTGTVSPEFRFWYHMLGNAVGNIAVDVLTANGWTFNVITPIFGNQGNQWNQQSIDLSAYTGQTVSLRFRITTGSGFESDIAIDDVELLDVFTGLNKIRTDEYSLYPNPTEGQFNIQLKEGQIGDIRIFDLQGRNVFTSFESSANAELDLSSLNKGIYIIEFSEGKREKIIIQ